MAMVSRSPFDSARGVGSAPVVKVTSNTWERDSHDLFDFETQQLNSKTFSAQGPITFVRNGADVGIAQDSAAIPSGTDSLVRVVERAGGFWVDRATSASAQKLWMVVRDMAPMGHPLTEGDVVKLGRFKFRVRQLVTGEEGESVRPNLGLDDTCMPCSPEASENLEAKPCRICLMEGPEEGDPLIMPCQCKGSIQYVHLGCLRQWTTSRLNLGEDPLGSYFYKPTTCELCHAPFPSYMASEDGPRKPLMELPTTRPPYIVLESTLRDARQQTRGFHVISLAEKPVRFGRGHESDVRIADVSMSRHHASIRFEHGRFLLQDNNSKFGTLVAMKRPRLVEAGKPLALQVGRTVLSLSLCPRDSVDAVSPWPQPAGVPLPSMALGAPVEDHTLSNLRGEFLPNSPVAGGSSPEFAESIVGTDLAVQVHENVDANGVYVLRRMSF